jgi:hypothetical protein
VLVLRDTGLIESQVVRIGSTTDGQKNVGTSHYSVPIVTIHANGNGIPLWGKADALGIQPYVYSFSLQDLEDRSGDVLVLPVDEPVAHLDEVTSLPKRRYIWANSSPI